MTVRVLEGHVLDVLRSLPSNTFQCVAASPPYYGLRDYGLPPQVWGGEAEHEHVFGPLAVVRDTGRRDAGRRRASGQGVSDTGFPVGVGSEAHETAAAGVFCACSAWLGSLGLEPTPELYVEHLVSVFREVRRVLRPDGVCWVNLGDSYAGSGKGPSESIQPVASQLGRLSGLSDCKPKDLLGMPWMVAFALRADGWYLRAEIIWSKPNPMPESVTDRPTKAHETVFLLAKSRTYFYDVDAVRETHAPSSIERGQRGWKPSTRNSENKPPEESERWRVKELAYNPAGRNKRSVWEIATAPFPGSHFAVFPPKLVEPMLLAGTSEKGCCPECGKPWARVAGRPCKACGDFIPFQGKSCPSCGHVNDWKAERGISEAFGTTDWSTAGRATPRKLGTSGKQGAVPSQIRLHGEWGPTCAHDAAPVPCQVLDPFAGAGTTGLVADRLGRDCTLIELNPEYAQMARERIEQDAPLFAGVPIDARPRAVKATETPRNDGDRWNQNNGRGFLPREVVG